MLGNSSVLEWQHFNVHSIMYGHWTVIIRYLKAVDTKKQHLAL
jgi:hypothetical protein